MEASNEVGLIKDSYQQLKTHIIDHTTRRQISADVLADLKKCFQKEINSTRRLSRIDSVEDLIRVLEKRDVLNPLKVDHLEKVIGTVGADKSKYLSHRQLISAGSTRVPVNNLIIEDDNEVRPTLGQYSQPGRYDNVNMGHTHANNCCTPSVVDNRRYQQCNLRQYSDYSMLNNSNRSRLRPEVIDVICSDIGYKWKDLARSLEVKEGTIDEIDTNYRTNPVKCRAMLEEYEKLVKQCEVNHKLLKALPKARRKDLAEKVQSLLVS